MRWTLRLHTRDARHATYLTVTVSGTNDHSPVFPSGEFHLDACARTSRWKLTKCTDHPRHSGGAPAPTCATACWRGARGIFEMSGARAWSHARAVVDREEGGQLPAAGGGQRPGRNRAAQRHRHRASWWRTRTTTTPSLTRAHVVQVPEGVAVNCAGAASAGLRTPRPGPERCHPLQHRQREPEGQFYLHSLSAAWA